MTSKQPGSMKACILGGTGFIGRHLASRLIRQGHRVRVPTRSRRRGAHLLVLPGLELVQTDIHKEAALGELVDGCDTVVNLVGILNEKGHDGSGFRKAHVELAGKLMGACRAHGVRRVVQMSALKANAERGASHYLQTKGQAEQIVKRECGDAIRYSILRPSVVFGPEDSFLNRFAGLLKMTPVLPLAKPQASFAPVYVDDVVSAVVACLADASMHAKTLELCGPEVFSLREIVDYVNELLQLHRFIVSLPDPIARLQAVFCEYLVPGKPFSVDNLRSLGVSSVCSDNGLKKLGIKPQKLRNIAPAYMSVDKRQSRIARLRDRAGRHG